MNRWKKSRPVFLIAIATGTMLNPLNSSMIALALNSIQNDYKLSFTTVSWLVSGFYIVSAIGQPVTGKIGDLVGRKKMFLIGLLISAIAAFGAPLAPTFVLLLLMRILQALGSSTLYPSGVALVRSHVDHSKQASSLAILAIFASVMTAFGPTVGGFLIVWGGWQSIFTVNFPFILISFVLGWFVIPKSEKKKPIQLKTMIYRLDVPGILFFTVGMVSLLWFLLSLDQGANKGSAVLGLFCFALFVWHEWRTKAPFIDLRLLKRNHALTLVYVLFVLVNVINYCLFFGLPSYFQGAIHLGVRLSGAMMLFMSSASVLASLATGRWADRAGTIRPIISSIALTAAGSVLLLFASAWSSLWIIGGGMLFIGAGYGIANVALQSAMLDASPKDAVGASSGLFQTCRFLGSILASAVLGLIFGKTVTPEHLFTLSLVLIGVSVPGFLLSLIFLRSGGRRGAVR
ncbi:MFS transporter [Sporolactobacillus sp. THM7-4]|nr:MFS transporter [Sporolactobacillus sp. THM7-4]